MSNATRFDLTREEIIERYRQRIVRGDRTKLPKDELGQLALHFVDRLRQLTSEDDIRHLCHTEIALLEEGYPLSSIGSYLVPTYRRLINEAIANRSLPLTDQNSHWVSWTKRNTGEQGQSQEHLALTYFKFDQNTYIKLRQATTAHNNQRQDNLQVVPLHQYLHKARELLTSTEPETLALALCAVTGRRHTEVVAKGKFERTSYAYTLHFAGQQKDPDTPPFDILTLIPAAEVLTAIERFRALPSVVNLAGLGHDAPEIDAFNGRVNRRVEKHFGGIVPVLDGFKTVSVHRLRGVYGAIALHFFCPPQQHEHRFLQHYLGHLLDEQGRYLPNAAATQHYFHYRLADDTGQVLQTRGILLMADDPLPIPDAEQIPQTVELTPAGVDTTIEPADSPSPSVRQRSSSKRGSLRIDASERDRWLAVLDELAPDCTNQQQKMTALLSWIESHQQQTKPSTEATPPAASPLVPDTPILAQAVADQSRTLAWLTQEVELLRQQLTTLQTARDQAVAQLTATSQAHNHVDQIRAENSRLVTELAQAQAKLDGFRQLLNGNGQSQSVTSSQPPTSVPSRVTSSPVLTSTSDQSVSVAPVPKPPKAGGAKDRAMGIFLALQDWNRQHPDKTFALTPGLLEREFGIHRQAAQEFLTEHHHLVSDYHQQIQVTNARSHNRGKDVALLKSFVTGAAHGDLPPSLPTSELTDDRIEQAVQAIMDFNNYTATELDQKWALTPTAVAQLSGGDRSQVERFFQSHHLAISDHNSKHQLSPRHNTAKTQKGQKPQDFIQL